MADQGSPVLSGTGGFTPINRSPGNDSMSSGLPVQDDKKRRPEAQVAAVVSYDRPKVNPEPLRDLQLSSSSEAGSHRTSGGVLLPVELRANVALHHLEFRVAVDACRLRSSLVRRVLPRVLGFQFLSWWIKALQSTGRR